MLALLALALVIALIIFRRVGKYEVPIWVSMAIGAVLVLLTGAITPIAAWNAIDFGVIAFLFGAFAIARALEASGLLEQYTYQAVGKAKNYRDLLLIIIFGTGFLSALLMNDIFAVVGTPIVILMARKLGLSAKPFLLALAFAVTIGSVFSPIGNPQNLLIATKSGMPTPFVLFAVHLLLPTIINLAIAFMLIRFFYPETKETKELKLSENVSMVRDAKLARIAKLCTGIFALLILLRVLAGLLGFEALLPLPALSLIAALPLFLFSERRVDIAKSLDWGTLVLFASMFILMQAVWNEGVFQSLISSLSIDVKSIPAILIVSTIVSQFVSNVPFTALYLPLLTAAGAGTKEYLALAAGTTLAGNLTLLGAASNLIIVTGAEKRGERISFLEFAKIGAVLTLLNLMIVYAFLLIF